MESIKKGKKDIIANRLVETIQTNDAMVDISIFVALVYQNMVLL